MKINSKKYVNFNAFVSYRHQIYLNIYNFEVSIHEGNEIEALKCLHKNNGGQIVDLKSDPTIVTKLSAIVSLISKTVFRQSIILPLVKIFFFVFVIKAPS